MERRGRRIVMGIGMVLSKLSKFKVQLLRGVPLRRPGVTFRVRIGVKGPPSRAPDPHRRDHPHTPVEPAAAPQGAGETAPTDDQITLPLGGVVVTTALATALLIAALLVTFRPASTTPLSDGAEQRRARFEALDELRLLALERRRIEGMAMAARVADQQLAEEWSYLGAAAHRLAEHQQRSLDQAELLSERLTFLAERSYQLAADDSPLPEVLRSEAARLGKEAEGYRTVLGREVAVLEGYRETLAEQLERVELDQRQATLQGLSVRIIYDRQRLADATEVADALRQVGASPELHPNPLDEPGQHKGRLYYRGADEEVVARRIARLAEPVERLEIEAVGLAVPYLSLWIVGPPPLGLEDASDPWVEDGANDLPDDTEPGPGEGAGSPSEP